MLTRVVFLAAATGLLSASAAAQGPVFEPDDFVNPGMGYGSMFLSRATIGEVFNPTNHYRPVDGNVAAVLITNSFYIRQFQFDYMHTELYGDDNPPPLYECNCPGGPVYFPTPGNPPAPPPGRSETLRLGLYCTWCGSSPSPNTLRYRLSWSRQTINVPLKTTAEGPVVKWRSGHDQSIAFDADTHLRIGERDVWGSLYVARTSLSGTPGRRAQNEFLYTNRFAGWYVRDVLLRMSVRVGGITGRDATGLNVINPYFEALWHHRRSKANFHFVWSAERTRSREAGWQTNHQIAVFLDRKLYMKEFGPRPGSR